jgi:hypothetical protein
VAMGIHDDVVPYFCFLYTTTTTTSSIPRAAPGNAFPFGDQPRIIRGEHAREGAARGFMDPTNSAYWRKGPAMMIDVGDG